MCCCLAHSPGWFTYYPPHARFLFLCLHGDLLYIISLSSASIPFHNNRSFHLCQGFGLERSHYAWIHKTCTFYTILCPAWSEKLRFLLSINLLYWNMERHLLRGLYPEDFALDKCCQRRSYFHFHWYWY